MPTEGLRIASSGQIVAGYGSITDAGDLCESLRATLLAAGWVQIDSLYPRSHMEAWLGLPVIDMPPEGYVLQPWTANPRYVHVCVINDKTFVIYDPTRFLPPAGAGIVAVPAGATMIGTAENLASKIDEYTDWTATVSTAKLGTYQKDVIVWDLTAKRPGTELNDSTFSGGLQGINNAYNQAWGGGYLMASQSAPVTGTRIFLRMFEGFAPHGGTAQDRHFLELDVSVSAGPDVIPLILEIGWYGTTPAGPYRIIANPYQLVVYSTSDTERGGRCILLSCPWVREDKGITSCAIVYGYGAVLYGGSFAGGLYNVIGGANSMHSLAYTGWQLFVAFNGRLRQVQMPPDPPVFMGRAIHGAAPLLTLTGEPLIQTAWFAMSEDMGASKVPKIVGLLWDTVAMSDSRFSIGDTKRMGDAEWECIAKEPSLLSMSLWARTAN